MISGGLWTRNIFKDSTPLTPLVSIVTVTFNAEQFLEQALDSILNQTYGNFELIVIDGGSIDRTIDIIRQRDDVIDFWVSEKDLGIYDAMNKGLRLARGRWIGFKNADDWYVSNAIENLVQATLLNEAEVFYGNSYSVLNESPLEVSPFFTDHNTLGIGPGIDHRSVFFLTEFHNKIPFDLSFKLAADFDVFCRMREYGAKFFHLDSFISYKRFGGASDGVIILKETFRINLKYSGVFFAVYSAGKSLFSFYFLQIMNFTLKIFLGNKRFYAFKSRKLA